MATPAWRILALTACVLAAWLAPRSPRAEDAPAPAPPLRAAVTMVGHAPEAPALREVTGELLARERVAVTWSSREGFRAQDIFERAPAADQGAIAVWIDLSETEQARLYFHDARAERFFLRAVSLPRGVDELAKEEIAHIVANAVVALGTGSGEALTRNQARTALQLPPPVAEVGPSAPPAPPVLQGSVAVLAGAQRFADELPWVAKGSALLQLTHRWASPRIPALGAWVGFDYQLSARHREDRVGARLQALAWRAGLLVTIALPHSLRLSLAAGAGVERIRYWPEARSEGIVAAPAGSVDVPVLAFWAGLDWQLVGRLALTLHLGAGVPLEKVHFDLDTGAGETSRVIELHAFRPGAAVGLAYGF